MSDDIFGRLFDLFDQPGPVNWKLAAEVARHLTGDPVPVEPWAAEEFRELSQLVEYRVEQVAPFRVRPSVDVLPLDSRGWAEKNLESYGTLAEPFASSVMSEGAAAALIQQMSPSIIGLQVGSLVGSLALWAVASFDAGLPQDHPGPLAIIVPNIHSLEQLCDTDNREVRLWVMSNEVAFRAVSQLPWVADHLYTLASNYAAAVQIDPTKLSGLVAGGNDPVSIESAIEDAGGIEQLIGGEEAALPRRELEAFLGAMTGCARLLARRATRELSPNFDQISAARDLARGNQEHNLAVGLGPVPAEVTRLGDEFNQEVERRYGDDALEVLWSDPSRIPNAAELRDPTAWAARVLLDGWT